MMSIQQLHNFANFAKFRPFLAAILFWANSANCQFASNDCTPRTPINVSLPQIDGDWYIAVYINETNIQEHMSCMKISYNYNPDKGTTHEVRSAIHYGETEPQTNSEDYGMTSPGVNNVTYPPDIHILGRFLEYTPNETFIISVCEHINGTKAIDRIAMLVRKRSQITTGLIRKKLRSVGISGHRYNTYYLVPQTDCPN